jgi:hypothetical protein
MQGVAVVERTLRDLQALVRRTEPIIAENYAMSRRIPRDLATPDQRMLYLDRSELVAFEQTVAQVLADLRFEHLDKKGDEKVWRFVCQASLDPGPDFVPDFVGQHAKEPRERTCFFPIDHLTVEQPRTLAECVLLPVGDPQLPPVAGAFELVPPVGAVAAVPVLGTHLGRMKDRAAKAVDHSLRVLRVALREHSWVRDEQLRFGRALGYSFGDGLVGWALRSDARIDLRLDDELEALVDSQPISTLGAEPANDIERKALLALRWIERGALTGDRLESLLFYFFALEALLGDRSEGLKARGLAFRRAMLNVAIRGHFADPNRVLLLYDEVRSAAVHGAEPPDVSRELASKFTWDVRRAVNEFLEFARREGLQRRGRVLKALDSHPEREELAAWLRTNGGENWADF